MSDLGGAQLLEPERALADVVSERFFDARHSVVTLYYMRPGGCFHYSASDCTANEKRKHTLQSIAVVPILADVVEVKTGSRSTAH